MEDLLGSESPTRKRRLSSASLSNFDLRSPLKSLIFLPDGFDSVEGLRCSLVEESRFFSKGLPFEDFFGDFWDSVICDKSIQYYNTQLLPHMDII